MPRPPGSPTCIIVARWNVTTFLKHSMTQGENAVINAGYSIKHYVASYDLLDWFWWNKAHSPGEKIIFQNLDKPALCRCHFDVDILVGTHCIRAFNRMDDVYTFCFNKCLSSGEMLQVMLNYERTGLHRGLFNSAVRMTILVCPICLCRR